ncbi:MAG: helicase-associated domain-containing protein, partial [Acidimicrobiales bacterium]
LAFLEAHASKGVPQPLAYLVSDLGRRFGRVRVGSAGCYVRCEDPSLLAEVTKMRKAAGLGLRLLAPTVAVASAEPAAVLATLAGGGYLAAPEDESGGLVIRRRQARRAAPPPPPYRGRVVTPLSPAEVVAALRGKPAAPVPSLPPLPALRLLGLEDLEDLENLEDDAPRPTAIAHGPAAAQLVALACDEEWMVRLGYTNGRNQLVEQTVAVMEIGDGLALVERLPRWDAQTLPLDRIQWARVLTETEEARMLYG